METTSNASCSDAKIHVTTSEFLVSGKEIFILSLIFLLLIYSVVAFLKHWNKNYRNINHLPHFSEEHANIETGKEPSTLFA